MLLMLAWAWIMTCLGPFAGACRTVSHSSSPEDWELAWLPKIFRA